ncbi:drebrin isoform X2 [Ornithorhynchus anatinus]|uniref:drebrin isoform X2 n=1 Tax=Ornithorhynchus anatinus TaxID=9258 RepID=UPI0010A87002|nr:drebrin isoform X2 [Ornithorhynchus anatinus]
MASVSFSGHRLALLAAYQEVIREESPADWALYTYEDDSDDLKLAASGGGGLQELSGHFENQKVMYGFCSVKDSQAALPKYVLINWVGEDVPDARKCACASHVAKVAEFFQGVDVIVNASSVEDIDAGAIGQRLSNGLARLSSPVLHRLRLREDENTEPVGTTYQKTDAALEMKRINREQFWEQAKKEEELRKEEERKKALDERLKFEQERMEQERQEQEEREKRYQEREQQIDEHRRKQQSLEAEEAKQRLKEQSIFGEQREEEEETQLKKSESEVEEAAAIIAQRPDNPREFFKQQERVASAGSCDAPSPFNHRTGRPHCPFMKAPDSGPSSSSSSSSSPPRTPFPYVSCHRTPNLSSSFPCGQVDGHRKPPSSAARSPSASSAASTPVGEPMERPLEETTSQTFPRAAESPSASDEVPEAAEVTEGQHWPFPAQDPQGTKPEEPPGLASGPEEGLVSMETKDEAEPVPAPPVPPAPQEESSMELGEPAETPETTAPESLIDLWQSERAQSPAEWELQADMRAPTPPPGPEAMLVEAFSPPPEAPPVILAGAAAEPPPPASAPLEDGSGGGGGGSNLLNFDELPEPPATFCDPEEPGEELGEEPGQEPGEELGEEPAALTASEGSQPAALGYQPTPQEAPEDHPPPSDLEELEQESHLLTNGETAQKEGTQASEGYFSQSQDEEFAQSEELSAKTPPPVFYNKPPEIDVTCWDTDPVPEDEEGFGGNV